MLKKTYYSWNCDDRESNDTIENLNFTSQQQNKLFESYFNDNFLIFQVEKIISQQFLLRQPRPDTNVKNP